MITASAIQSVLDCGLRVFAGEIDPLTRSSSSAGLGSTLRQVYELAYLPLVAKPLGLRPTTLAEDRSFLALWEALTSDPPLASITRSTTAGFVARLQQRKAGRNGVLSAATVAKHVITLRKLLRFCGPIIPGDAVGEQNLELLSCPPLPLKPIVDQTAPAEAFTLEEIQRIYAAAHTMRRPLVPGVVPRDWWQSLVCVGCYTGLRIGDLMRLEFAHVSGGFINLPPVGRKGRKFLRRVLHADAAAAIERIRTYRKFVFVYPGAQETGSIRSMRERWRSLLRAAGIANGRPTGFHALRRLHATATFAAAAEAGSDDPLAESQAALDHRDSRTTATHYVASSAQDAQQMKSVERLPNMSPKSTSQRLLF